MGSRKITQQELDILLANTITVINTHIDDLSKHLPTGGLPTQVVGKLPNGEIGWLDNASGSIPNATLIPLPTSDTSFVGKNVYLALTELLQKVNAEISARASADSALNTRIDGIGNIRADLNAEIIARANGDSNLLALLNAEIANRAQGDTSINTRITTLSSDVLSLKTQVNDGKNLIATAIIDKGGDANGSDTFQQLADAILAIVCEQLELLLIELEDHVDFNNGVYAVDIATGYSGSILVQSDGTVVVGSNSSAFNANQIETEITNAKHVAMGYIHMLILKSDGSVVAYGGDNYGQVSSINNENITNGVAVAAGRYTSLVARTDGTVFACGTDSSGSVIGPNGATDVIDVAAGWIHSVVLKSNGAVFAYGNDRNGKVSALNNAGIDNAIAIAAPPEGEYSLVLREGGVVVAFGDDSIATKINAALITDAIAIAAAQNHCLILHSNHTVSAYGLEWTAVTGVNNSGITNAVGVAAGLISSLILTSDGRVYGYANNPDTGVTVMNDYRPQLNSIDISDDVSVELKDFVIRKHYAEYTNYGITTFTDVALRVSSISQSFMQVGERVLVLLRRSYYQEWQYQNGTVKDTYVDGNGDFWAKITLDGEKQYDFMYDIDYGPPKIYPISNVNESAGPVRVLADQTIGMYRRMPTIYSYFERGVDFSSEVHVGDILTVEGPWVADTPIESQPPFPKRVNLWRVLDVRYDGGMTTQTILTMEPYQEAPFLMSCNPRVTYIELPA